MATTNASSCECRSNRLQIVDSALYCSDNPEEDFQNVLEKRLSVDNLVFHGSLVAFHKNQLDCHADDMPLNNVTLFHLINVGTCDMDITDKPWDASTRSMRYAACLGDCLWTMIAREQNRVSVFCFFNLLRNWTHCFRTIVWRLGSTSWRRPLVEGRWSTSMPRSRTPWSCSPLSRSWGRIPKLAGWS